MSTYSYCITRSSAHAVRTAMLPQPADPLQVAADARETELEAAALAARWTIAARRHHEQQDRREQAPEASHTLP